MGIKKIFTKEYWTSSLEKFLDIKSLALMAIFLAATVVVGGFCSISPIKIFGRELSVVFLFWPIIGILFGPIPSCVLAGTCDIIIFFLFPSGYPFYLGYTLTQMLLGFICGIFFYKQKISIISIVLCKGLINFGIHVGIESLFMMDMYKYTWEQYVTYVSTGALKNLIMWPIECVLMFVVLVALLPVMHSLKLIDEDIPTTVKLL